MSGREQLIIDMKRSIRLFCTLSFAHGMAAIALFSLRLPLYQTFISMLLIGFSLGYYILKAHEVVRIVLLPENEWHIEKYNGSTHSVKFTGYVYSNCWLMLLAYKCDESKCPSYIVLMKDSVSESVFSQLKLHLKIYGSDQ